MELSEKQKAEIKNYMITIPKYRETYDELYDHILNALADDDSKYGIDKVIFIVNNHFGGFMNIIDQEKTCHQEIGKKYNREFRQQLITTLGGPGLLVFAFCLLVYYCSRFATFSIKPMLMLTILSSICVAVFAFMKIFMNRVKYSKFSILDNYLALDCSYGVAGIGLFLHSVLNENIFNLDDNGKLIATLILHFICIIYVKTFMKIYNQKFRILTT